MSDQHGADVRSVPASSPPAYLGELSEHMTASTVDGVTVLHAHRDGPVTGALVFRVGWVDEPLARAGITHLVEHLALFGQNSADVHHNGATSETITVFHATGSAAEVVRFLNEVCASLRDLPFDRMETEKEILRTEAARGGWSAVKQHRVERYGASGPGLVAFETFGLSAIGRDDLRGWAEQRFTRGNAIAWITTEDLPDGLDLRLPEGPRRAVPDIPEIIPVRQLLRREQG